MLPKNDYNGIASDSGLNVVCEMDKDYNLYTQRLNCTYKATNVYSVAKLFTVTAIGMLYSEGRLDVKDKFIDIMDITLPDFADVRWKNVTLEMLMRHRAGFARGILDIDVEDVLSYGTKNYLSVALKQPLSYQDEGKYRYTDAAYYLLSLAVEKISGKSLFDYMRDTLMVKMDFAEYGWASCPLGHSMGATGLYIRCEDMVKLGVLYLNGGVWKGKRIFSEKFCSLAIENEYSISSYGGGWFGKGGMYGQILAFNFEKGLAIACTSFSKDINVNSLLGIEANQN